MRTRIGLALVGLAALVAAALAMPGASAAPPCVTGSVSGYLDYAADVTDDTTSLEVAGHDGFDIIEVRSCVVGSEIAVGVRVVGLIDKNTDSSQYTVYLRGPGLEGENLYFSNGNATYFDDSFDEVAINSSAAADWLTMYLPLEAYGNQTTGWTAEASATDSATTGFSDWAELDTSGEYGEVTDITLEPTAFNNPTVTISSVVVTQLGGGYQLVVEGTTTGPVAELRVAMGTNLTAGGVGSLWLWSNYWLEQDFASGDANVELTKVGGSWASWRFTRNYTEADLKGSFGSLFSVGPSKLEVRAIAGDGKWGHANQSFQANTVAPPPGTNTGGTAGGSSTMLIVAVVALAAVGALAGVFLMRKKKKAAPPPT